jgi:hypothetical protein
MCALVYTGHVGGWGSLLAAGKMRPATEAAKKDPSRGGSGQEVRPSFAVNRGIMTNEIQFVTAVRQLAE